MRLQQWKALAFGFSVSILTAVHPVHADAPAPLPAQLEIVWSTPTTTEFASDDASGRSRGLVLRTVKVSPVGAIVAFGAMTGPQRSGGVLLLDAENAGPDPAVPLRLPKPDVGALQSFGASLFGLRKPIRDQAVLTFAFDPAGEIWLGGFSNSYMGIASDAHRDAYLAKLDRAGKLLWERSYGKGDWLTIESIAPALPGGLVGVGRGHNTSWLARIAPDGALMAERRFGNGKGVTVVPLRNGQFLVAGFTSEGKAATYKDDVSIWLFDGSGDLHGPIRIREAINRFSIGHFGKITASTTKDGAYVASAWGDDPSRLSAVEVAHIGADGNVLWLQKLPDTVGAGENGRLRGCDPALVTLANGDALVACALNGQIRIYRLDRQTGQQRAAQLPLPPCQLASPTLFLNARQDGTVFLAGSRPEINVAAGCSWVGRLSIQAD